MRKLAMLIVAVLILFTAGCGNKEMEKENITLKDEISQLRSELAGLEAEIENLKNAPDNLYKEAKQLFSENKLDEAEKVFSKIIKEYPTAAIKSNAEEGLALISNTRNEIKQQEKNGYDEVVAKAKIQKSAAESKNILQDYLNNNSNSSYKNEIEALIKEYEQKRLKEIEEANKPPIEAVRAWVTFNSIGNPEARVRVKNISKKTIDAFTMDIHCYDNFNRPVNHYLRDDNIFGAISQNYKLAPGEVKGDSYYWTLYGHDNTTNIEVNLKEAHFTDNTTWHR
ncbi:MAG TPA: hypothetical protein DEF34_03125 [Desulfotomaculum sp.]|nr:MAG: hypothetical protein JL56_02745 [Desulfotomaculum sp. BICA1-6]HBX22619.1 hypothetical protein [Desulfotomaculum sp.]